MKVSRIGELNDPFEFLAVDLLNKRHRLAVNRFKEDIDRTHGVLCFFRSYKNPVVWSHYADRHRGVALCFEIPDEKVIEIDYTEERPSVNFDEKSEKIINPEKVVEHLIKSKFRDWEYEEEVRMYVSLTDKTPESGMVFEGFSDELKLRGVILGARCDLPLDGIRRLARATMATAFVSKAKMALRQFRIVED
jgi:hypothetical protein